MTKKLDIIPFQQWNIFANNRPVIISGPCSAETREQILSTASGVKKLGISAFRAGIWKPRTHPGCFEGIGTEGLAWLEEVRKKESIAVCTEVATKEHVEQCLKHNIDFVWIGARTTTNPFLVQEIAEALQGTDIPVLVKNPINHDMELWLGALERLNAMGIKKLGVIHRGVSPIVCGRYRNDPQWHMVTELRAAYPEMLFLCDPSHMGGSREYLSEISQKAMDLGLDGLMIESHCCPKQALSDAKQQVTPEELGFILRSLHLRKATSLDDDYLRQIDRLRSRIDACDESLISILAQRLEISREIGRYKQKHNIAIIQGIRWNELIEDVLDKAQRNGLSAKYITKLFNTIHEESVEVQNSIRDEQN
ncbi:MAG: bifunctional 3-deoxy-7-phosphoheptulonate synthase/chorismate mutase type II [Alistipes sp.]|nr:bifunctional 3-deoxy-7-phosphoheptulonate synthase/chorismate mutase type II [Candidatus Alistipes equi]